MAMENKKTDFGSNCKSHLQDISQTRSTREQIVAHLNAIGHKPPPDNLSREEIEALRATGEVIEANPVPGVNPVHELPPSEVDQPKHVAYGMSHLDRNFWFNIVIGCSGPDSVPRTVLSSNRFRSRNAAKLEYAMADVERLRGFVNNLCIDPKSVYPQGDRFFAGTFAETVYLREPSVADLNGAFEAMTSFFKRNQGDPEWMGGQVNFFFGGHGTDDSKSVADPINRGGLWLKDRVIGPKDLQDRLIGALPGSVLEPWRGFSTHGNCRVDMYLDCCYSGQFAAAFIARLLRDSRGLVPGKFWRSSMPFQESFEADELRHGIFTSYFLNDYSRRRTLASGSSLRSGDVGRGTGNRQNPFLIDFSTERPPLPIVPGAVGMIWIAKNFLPLTPDINNGEFANWLTDFLGDVYLKNWSKKNMWQRYVGRFLRY